MREREREHKPARGRGGGDRESEAGSVLTTERLYLKKNPGAPGWLSRLCPTLFIFFNVYLFLTETERERERDRA